MPAVKDAGLKFHPRKGTLLICDFRGSIHPEITKKRPVIVITPRLGYREGLCTIVPTSTTRPAHPQPFNVRLSRNYMPAGDPALEVWVKCDLVMSVSLARLDRIKVGDRKYVAPTISEDDLAAVIRGVLSGLGFPDGL